MNRNSIKKLVAVMMLSFILLSPHGKAQILPAPFIGTAVEVTGKVTAQSREGEKRKIKIGDSFSVSESVSTGRNGFLKIMLSDDTEFILGEKSKINMDAFIYDEATHEGEVSAYLEGTFRFITGKIAENKPENMTVKTHTAVIGVRGTKVAGKSSKSESFIVLEKPEKAEAKQSSIVVSSEVEGKTVEIEIKEYGFGTTVKRGKAPKPPVKISQKAMADLDNKLKPQLEESSHSPLSPFGAYDQVKRGVKGVASVARKVDPRGMMPDNRPKPPPKPEPKHEHHHNESS